MTRDLPAAAREWWSTPGPMTGLGAHRIELPLDADSRPEITDVVRAVQNLVVYDLVSEPFYGVALTPDRADDIHVRPVAELLDRAVAIDPASLTEPRPPARRVTGRCHTFAKLTVATDERRDHHRQVVGERAERFEGREVGGEFGMEYLEQLHRLGQVL